MLKILPKQLAFIPKLHEFCGHMGQKLLYKIKVHKDKKYSKLKTFNILLTLRFEGVVPTRVCGFKSRLQH
jgi:hypothetical protein